MVTEGPEIAVWGDDGLLAWVKRTLGQNTHILAKRTDSPRAEHNLASLIIGCDYACDVETCPARFRLAANWSGGTFLLARPLLLNGIVGCSQEYFLSAFGHPLEGLSALLAEVGFIESVSTAKYVQLLSSPRRVSINGILAMQKYIIQGRGKNTRICDIVRQSGAQLAVRAQSKVFKRLTGVSLKGFINKIRLCHCLSEVVLTPKLIKCIALDFGYKPVSFDLRFHKSFGTCPTEARLVDNRGHHAEPPVEVWKSGKNG